MARTKTVANFVAVSDISKPVAEQEGILLEVEGSGGDNEKNRAKALSMVNEMWEKGEIDQDKFPDGITDENIIYVPAEKKQPKRRKEELNSDVELLPVVQGAQEIIQLTKLQLEAQEAAEEAAPYVPMIEALLERSRPLTIEEKELAKDKKYGKIIERIGTAIASQEEYQATCTGNGKLILNAIAWHMTQKNDPPTDENSH